MIFKVSKGAKIRNRYNQVPHLTRDTNGKMTNSQLDKTNYRLMQVKSISECAYLFIKLPFVIKIFVLSIFEWLFYTLLTVFQVSACTSMVLFLIMLLDNKLVVVKRVKA